MRPGKAGGRTLAALAALALCLVLVAGCGGKHDISPGPAPSPPGPGETPKAPSGTFRPYTINGQTYYPITSAHGYVEEGTASWYGSDFDGKPTASGEIYDMHAMTAAHKILPIHTRLQVTNLENGRTIEVRVNDRGPFVGSRIIDLSYASAKKLGMSDKGLAHVRIQTVGTVPGMSGNDLKGSFYVQVGAFTVRDNAVRLAAKMRDQYSGTRIERAQVKGRTFWRVQAGMFTTLSHARSAQARLASSYPQAFVINSR